MRQKTSSASRPPWPSTTCPAWIRDLPKPPRRELARWATLPHLLPLLAPVPVYVPHVVVQIGRTAATITGFDRTGREVLGVAEEGGLVTEEMMRAPSPGAPIPSAIGTEARVA